MSRRSRKPKKSLPAAYGLVRIPIEVVLQRFRVGDELRRVLREAAGGTEREEPSIYESRGVRYA